MFDTDRGSTLLLLARSAIAREFGLVSEELPRTGWLNEPGATFVTLTLSGQLRGCIGSLEAHRSLIDDVRKNAVASAFRDPRFNPLSPKELTEVVIEVSLIGPATPIRFSGEQEALSQLNPGEDVLILEYGHHRATFLPQVWEQLPDPRSFISHLKNKAGLAEDFWSDDIRLSRYTVQKWREVKPHE